MEQVGNRDITIDFGIISTKRNLPTS